MTRRSAAVSACRALRFGAGSIRPAVAAAMLLPALLASNGVTAAQEKRYWVCQDPQQGKSVQETACRPDQVTLRVPPGVPAAPEIVQEPIAAAAPRPAPDRPAVLAPSVRAMPERPRQANVFQPIIDAVWKSAAWVIALLVVFAAVRILLGRSRPEGTRKRSVASRREPATTPSANPAASLTGVNKLVGTPHTPVAAPVLSWNMDLLHALEWKRFEELCQRLWLARGRDARVTCSGADGGIDVEVYADDGSGKVDIIIQCKSWASRQVGVDVIRATWGVRDHVSATHAIVYAVGGFTEAATLFAAGKALQLIDGPALLAEILALPHDSMADLLSQVTRGDYTTPSCPKCDARMVRRAAKSGRAEFWGCPRYPVCTASPIPFRA